ncbi:aldehyde dehydrogenase family protein [Algibacter sp. 2305UL17-15]|uniref:aldehyde dehydrogenase family protein n=1 Tax=Algibacter sp. 2305UL17-15 TaxID=3231268 RepID=UPI00345AB31C
MSLRGSVGVVQEIITDAAENITKLSLELGRKAPAIVCSDANLDLAVNAIVSSKVNFSGKVCNCAERVYLQDAVYDEFVAKIPKK